MKLGVAYHLRRRHGVREARRLVAEGALGTVALAQGQWGFGVRGQDRLTSGLRHYHHSILSDRLFLENTVKAAYRDGL